MLLYSRYEWSPLSLKATDEDEHTSVYVKGLLGSLAVRFMYWLK